MGYIDGNLMNNESIVGRAHLHWSVYISALVWFSIGVFFIVSNTMSLGLSLGVLCIVMSIAAGIVAFINKLTSEFGVTNKRVLLKTGLIRRNSLEVLLSKVEGIQVDQGILGRILGYGSVTVSGTGGAKDPYHRIADPLGFRKLVQEQISASE